MSNLQQNWLMTIGSYDSVVIIRHGHPDGDAIGSQFALKAYINKYYPSCHVYALGNDADPYDMVGPMDTVDKTIFDSALILALDCGNIERLDTPYPLSDQTIIKVDHHLNNTPYGNIQDVDDSCGATCQLLWRRFKEMGKPLDPLIAYYLAFGMITDTVSFSAGYTSVETITAYADCLSYGIDHVELFKNATSVTPDAFRGSTLIRQYATIRDGLAYTIIDQEMLDQAGLKLEDVRDYVNELKGIRGVEVWMIATPDPDVEGGFKVSLRSYKANINAIARRHNGGGHLAASGCSAANMDEVLIIVDELKQAAKSVEMGKIS